MGRPSENRDHPLQYIRLKARMTQDLFADVLGISKSELSKRETRAPGFADIPPALVKKVAREFGAVIYPFRHMKPTQWGGEALTEDSIKKHRSERPDWRLVKYPPADLLKALGIVAEACEKLSREDSLSRALEQMVKNLCVSPQLRLEIRNLLKKRIALKQPDDTTAAHWLARAIEEKELAKDLPTLPAIVEHDKMMEAKIPGARSVTKENAIDLLREMYLMRRGDVENF